MKTGIIYATKTKHSKKIAETVGSALGIKARDIRESPVIRDTDLIFIVGGIYGGASMPELLQYVKGLDAASIRRAALLTSCGSGAGRQTAVRGILEEKGIEVVDEFVCKGAILFVSARHPDQNDLRNAVDFARSIAGAGA